MPCVPRGKLCPGIQGKSKPSNGDQMRFYRAIQIVSLILTTALIVPQAPGQFAESGLSSVGQTKVVSLELHSQQASSEAIVAVENAWRPEAEELEWSRIEPVSLDVNWLQSDGGQGEGFAVVRGVANTDHAALNLAIEEQIMPWIEQRLPLDRPWKRHVAVRRLHRELQRSDVIQDRVEQTFYRAIDDEEHVAFTRDAVLVNISNDSMDRLMRPIRHDLRRGQKIRSGAFSFMAIVLGISSCVCWVGSRFIDRVTNGYYVWPIRLATATLLLAVFGATVGIAMSMLHTL